VTHQRVLAAERLLEESSMPVEQVAARVGFSNAAALRHHFTRVRRISPQQYRRRFAPEQQAG
jgi:transcriptional regulator GlxA family with amidase domain